MSDSPSRPPLLLFDGVCNLCHGAVQWILKRDRKKRFRFAALQSQAGREAMAEAGHEGPIPDSVVVIDDGRVYFGSSVDHRVHCRDVKTGKLLWSFYTDGPIRLAPTLAHANVYVGSDDGCVYCLKADTGELVWQQRVGPRDELVDQKMTFSRPKA